MKSKKKNFLQNCTFSRKSFFLSPIRTNIFMNCSLYTQTPSYEICIGLLVQSVSYFPAVFMCTVH